LGNLTVIMRETTSEQISRFARILMNLQKITLNSAGPDFVIDHRNGRCPPSGANASARRAPHGSRKRPDNASALLGRAVPSPRGTNANCKEEFGSHPEISSSETRLSSIAVTRCRSLRPLVAKRTQPTQRFEMANHNVEWCKRDVCIRLSDETPIMVKEEYSLDFANPM
jgi:hypothetical protein